MKRFAGGRGWSVRADGRIEVEGQGVISTAGAPVTARLFLLEHGDAVREASRRFDVPVPWLVGMTMIESVTVRESPRGGLGWDNKTVARARRLALPDAGLNQLRAAGYSESWLRTNNRRRRDVVSWREESGFVTPDDTPTRVSAGLMQTLLSTARAVVARFPDCAPRDHRGNVRPVHVGDLMLPELSLLWGAGYLAMLRDEYSGPIRHLTLDGVAPATGFDFVLATGAYNAGGLYIDTGAEPNPFKLLTYHSTRTDRAIRFYNDCYKAEVVDLWQGK